MKKIFSDYVTDEQYDTFMEIMSHPTYEELGHCLNDINPSKCDIEKRIGDFDVRCKGCPHRENYQMRLF